VFPQKFDLIHGRALVTCFNDPQRVIQSAADSLAPGGWLEMQDLVIPMRCVDDSWRGSQLERFNTFFVECAGRAGRDMSYSQRYAPMFRAAGLVDVTELHFAWPSSPWCKGRHLKKLASWFSKDMCDGVEAISMALLTRFGGMTEAEVKEFLEGVRKDVLNTRVHAYMPMSEPLHSAWMAAPLLTLSQCCRHGSQADIVGPFCQREGG
jgi:SAM-dependent methyltransferase